MPAICSKENSILVHFVLLSFCTCCRPANNQDLLDWLVSIVIVVKLSDEGETRPS